MKLTTAKPTDEFYGRLQRAYDYFNEKLFDKKLPACLITVQREKNMMGFFSPARWSTENAKDVHEIAINPAYFATRKVVEVFQTLVHEQCHVWQHEFGNPSRSSYHNDEWSRKMESIGLMPSTTGAKGGKRVGQKMSDYVIEGGKFKQVCTELFASGYHFKWVDKRASDYVGNAIEHATSPMLELLSEQTDSPEDLLNTCMAELIPNFQALTSSSGVERSKAKTKYCCPSCGANVWGKPNLNIGCNVCDENFEPE